MTYLELQSEYRATLRSRRAVCYGALAALFGLQMLDVLTTNRILALPDGMELNPIVAGLMTLLGGWWWIGKLAIVAGVTGFMAHARATRTALAMVAFSGLVVLSNLLVLM